MVWERLLICQKRACRSSAWAKRNCARRYFLCHLVALASRSHRQTLLFQRPASFWPRPFSKRIKHAKLKDLIFKEFLPQDLRKSVGSGGTSRSNRIPLSQDSWLVWGWQYISGLSWWPCRWSSLSLLPDYHLFIGADLCWGVDLLPYTRGRCVSCRHWSEITRKNTWLVWPCFGGYLLSAIRCLVSHDPGWRAEQILYGD